MCHEGDFDRVGDFRRVSAWKSQIGGKPLSSVFSIRKAVSTNCCRARCESVIIGRFEELNDSLLWCLLPARGL